MTQYHPEIIDAYIEQWESTRGLEGEAALHKLLRPMFEREGYTVLQNQIVEARSTVEWDFVVVKDRTPRFDSLSIGVEHKAHAKEKVDSRTVEQVLSRAHASQLKRACVFSRTGFSERALAYASRVVAPHLELFESFSLRRWADGLRPSEQEGKDHARRLGTSISRAFIESIAANPRFLDNLEWFHVEDTLAEAFDGLGFNVTHTSYSKDEGKDLILKFVVDGEEKSYIVEIKHWRSGNRVGSGKVADFFKVITRENRDGGLFLSTSGYTDTAFESLTEVERQVLRFGAESKVHAICKTYVRAKGGLWSPQATLVDTLFEGTQ
ncbi:restriction endonuclease [Paraburkholderia terrae]|uniref:restriction endonuclease n=1 Tax=Paraburkholderia terrae TaxID=311230 RepID=UPI00296AFA58|nr:restriction endonuclease [Paraburkholderia terrae]MDW3661310.1 restriction endonuclease [Paraburkholderia terrae]